MKKSIKEMITEAYNAVKAADPQGPCSDPNVSMPYEVAIPAATGEAELHDRWDKPQWWCRDNVIGRWGRGCDNDNNQYIFRFSSADDAAAFAVVFA